MLCDGIVFSHEKKEILPFSTWMDHESIVLNKSERDKCICCHIPVEGKKAKLVKTENWCFPEVKDGIGEMLLKDTNLELVVNKS